MNELSSTVACWMRFVFMLTGLLILSCNKINYDEQAVQSSIVVEGWIELGEVPKVILSRSIPINIQLDSANFMNYIIRSAKVVVSDGQHEEVLHLKVNNDLIPPFLYLGETMKGEEGKTYKLTISYLGRTLEAETSIPKSVAIERVRYQKIDTSKTGQLFIQFTDPVEKNYYQIATRLVGHDPIYIPALYGNLNDANFSEASMDLPITRGVTIFPKTNLNIFFNDGDQIYVRLRTMNKVGFDFWNSWQNELVNSQNPIFPANKSLKSTIKGGIGIWCGYGFSEVRLIAN